MISCRPPQSAHVIAAETAKAAGVPSQLASTTLLDQWRMNLGREPDIPSVDSLDPSAAALRGRPAGRKSVDNNLSLDSKDESLKGQQFYSTILDLHYFDPTAIYNAFYYILLSTDFQRLRQPATVMRHLGRIATTLGIPPSSIARRLDSDMTRLARNFGRRFIALRGSMDQDPEVRKLCNIFIRRKIGQEAHVYNSVLHSWKAHNNSQMEKKRVQNNDTWKSVHGGRITRRRPPKVRRPPEFEELNHPKLSGLIINETGSPTQSSRGRKPRSNPAVPPSSTKMQTRYASFNPTPGVKSTTPGQDDSMTETEQSDDSSSQCMSKKNSIMVLIPL